MSKFKDSMNRWVTSGLFKETAITTDEFVLMTLDEARMKYLDCGDPTGYVFATEHLGGYKHWKALKNSSVLSPIIDEWEEELEVFIRSVELKRIGELSSTGHFQASKFLMDRGWQKRKPGKPSKEEVERETRVQAKMKEEYTADVQRIKRD